jgi:RNA polymerase sigma factor (sigma-70 family)
VRLRSDPLRDPAPLIRRVYSYVAYRIGPGPDAEDVTGEVFARATRYRASYDATRGSPTQWVLGIATRVIADRRSDLLLTADPPEVAVDAFDDRVLSVIALRAAVAQLSDADRELIALRYGADLTTRDIAQITGRTPHAVDVALARALDRLRAWLANDPDESEGPIGMRR